ncbi:25S rRNA (adenine645-N1)-methyltransferase [Spizellomyces punctatus DAOM BR117]|uniref:Ribosomal RNA-processing protein 8 n=1 Tax=Spizellomyces punctatus (strain DAOM BR117) TaxID=645134 RepID=A0A0L0H5L1_SPIPD|nr:25S rRNA (adenine645-N1)-methyltransferase [Spizellomyces punctatus DAOM BR117]KNC96254.1 hypothetical protein SPPG_08406 [Spizellomyces punctatus DAOM BR117]|eukprot:XP_016604294.1 hypothetical protein SPPG_08406 [Spizellomyces punctatus DAOM BR117]
MAKRKNKKSKSGDTLTQSSIEGKEDANVVTSNKRPSEADRDNVQNVVKKQKLNSSQKDRLRKVLEKRSKGKPNSELASTPISKGPPKSTLKAGPLNAVREALKAGQQPKAGLIPTKQPAKPTSNLTALQEKMHKKLAGAKFRWINEILYTKESREAVKIFKEQPEMFDIYHEGFRSQTEGWPANPVDGFLAWLREKPDGTVVADMGCGDAKIARTLKAEEKKIVVHSFDLVKRCEEVVACDIAKVPLQSSSVDVVIFCLSLMGTNFMDFVLEAHRILRVNGELKIAEVISRFPDVDAFVDALSKAGFRMVRKDDSNTMFILFDFVKSSKKSVHGEKPKDGKKKRRGGGEEQTSEAIQSALLKPCMYKKR